MLFPSHQHFMKSVGIIGSGIGGIAAAIRLALKGYSVNVYEANAYPGGKLSEINGNGYRFDAGPSLFTLPRLVDELFELAGENPSDHFRYTKLDINCHYFYEDGLALKAYSDRERLLAEFVTKTNEDRASIEKVLDNSQTLYDLLADLFMYRSIHKAGTFFNSKAYKAYANLWKLDFFRTMHQANKKALKDPRIVQLFNRYATYNGSDPYQTPGTLNIIPHLEFNQGAYFPEKGMHDITLSLFKLAQGLGVDFHFNARVDSIKVSPQKAVDGLIVNGEKVKHDIVVSNMDIVNTYRKLLTSISQPNFLLTQPKSSSALILYWGIDKSFSELGLHNILFSKNYKLEFDHIFNRKTIFDDPTVYINITSKLKADDAPEGSENWFTMINVPNNSGQDWESLIAEARQNMLKKISRMLEVDISKHIVFEAQLDPRTIESKTSSAQGALYGNSSNNMFAAFLRHSNFSRRVKNLYFCGGSVHPGGGIPLSLLSAKIMAEEIPALDRPALHHG